MHNPQEIKGKILLVDDEKVEHLLLQEALKRLGTTVDIVYYNSATAALEYLNKTEDSIFLIMSDISMPKMNGLDFKRAIDKEENLRAKVVPFIFMTSAATKEQIEEAYEYRLQGYFLKPMDINEMARRLSIIINYWNISMRPDTDLLR
jgi:CheY-like chemotaxis protein